MPAVEILHAITDGAEFLEPGAIVQDPSPRLLELAREGNLHLGLQIARFYDPQVTAQEMEAKEKALAVTIPPLDRVREAAAVHGYELLLIGSERQFANLADDLQHQLFVAQAEITSLRQQLAEQAESLLDPAEPAQVENADMLAALSSSESASQAGSEDAPAEGGELAEAAAPLEDSPKPKRGR